jgi:hypothetical protein
MTHKPPTRTVLSLSALALLVTGAVLYAGPLDPPTGPITPTSKTLAEIEPRIAINATNTPGDADSVFRISQPGSYYLTGNVLGEANKRGVEIAASNVTLDLAGFVVDGQSIVSTLDGIALDGSTISIIIRNGQVRGWGDGGIDLFSPAIAPGNRVENVIARNNMGTGISPSDSASVIGCSAISNGGGGIAVSSSATIVNCIARANTGAGILTGSGCIIENSTARLNTGTGISVGTGSLARGCSAFDNELGFATGTGSVVEGCTATDNNTHGFFLGLSSQATACTATNNEDSGFSIAAGGMASGCQSSNNGLHGFSFSNFCLIKNNFAYTNGTGGVGAGFFSSSSDSRIEGNASRASDYGFWLSGTRNLIIGNSSVGATTTPWEIAANNVYGQIIDRSAAGTAAVSGSAAVSTILTTDPHANITH